MRNFVCRSLVWSMALLFVVSGAAARYCMAAHQSSFGHVGVVAAFDAEPNHGAHSAAHDGHVAHGQAAHDQHHDHQQQAFDADDGSAPDDAGCAKCCGTCTLATGVVAAEESPAVFTASETIYAFRARATAGSVIRVDPGVPKHIV